VDGWDEQFPPSDPFPLGDVNVIPPLEDPSIPFELDLVETRTHDSMALDEPAGGECKGSVLRELPDRFHDSTASVAVKAEPMSPSQRHGADDDSETYSGRARKRPRLEMAMPDPRRVMNVKAHVDELTALDSDTFDQFVAALEQVRKLSSAELSELKKMKRRIHNRESARRSRQDKRDHTGLLEDQVRQLADQLNEMRLEVASLHAANSQLQSEIAFSTQLIRSSPVLSQLFADLRAKHTAARAEQQQQEEPSALPFGPR